MKRPVVLIGIAALILLAVIVFVIPQIVNSGDQKILDSKLSSAGYYVAEGLEQNAVGIAALAVENFASQDVTEQKSDRDKRLAKYFAADSPVYNFALDNIGGKITKSATKTTAVLETVSECDGGQSYVCLRVYVRTEFSGDGSGLSANQNYWVKLITDKPKEYLAYDIGALNE